MRDGGPLNPLGCPIGVRWYMTPRLLRAPRLLLPCAPLVLGCWHRTNQEPFRPPIDGVRFVARAKLVPGDSLLEVRVRAVNTGRAIRTLEFGNCSMNVGVSSVGLTPARKWEYVVWAKSRRCLEYQATRDLAPGDSVSPSDYTRRVPIRAILGDSLPPGRYRITARVNANGRSSEHIEVGEFELGSPGTRASAVVAGGTDATRSDPRK